MKCVLSAAFSLSCVAVFAADLVYDVAEDETVVVSTNINATVADGQDLVKRGAGTLRLAGNVGADRRFPQLVVEAGTVELAMGNDQLRSTNVVIRSGATVRNVTTAAPFRGETSVDVAEGGLVDFGNVEETVDGFRGYGTVTNGSGVTLHLNLNKGPYRFGGRVVGKTRCECAGTSGTPAKRMVLCSSDVWKNGVLRLGSGTVTNLTFAPGIGSFYCYSIQTGSNRPVYLADENGDPVAFYAGQYSWGLGSGHFCGPGAFYYWWYNAEDCCTSGSIFGKMTGVLGVAGGSLCIGNYTEAGFPDLSSLTGIDVVKTPYCSNSRLQIRTRNCHTLNLDCLVSASSSTLDFIGPTVVRAFDAFDITFNCYTNLTMCGGNLGVRDGGWANKNAGCSFDCRGGVVSGARAIGFGLANYSHRYQPQATINAGGSSTVFTIRDRGEMCLKDYLPTLASVTDGGVLTFDGCVLWPYDGTGGSQTSIVRVDGGTLRLRGSIGAYKGTAGGATFGYDTARIRVEVGPKGVTLENFAEHGYWTDYHMIFTMPRPLYAAAAGDGGVTLEGGGHFVFKYPLELTGPFRAVDGTLDFKNYALLQEATGELFGSGEFLHGNSDIRLMLGEALTVRLGKTGGYRSCGASTYRLRSDGSTAKTVELGAFSRARGSALFLCDRSDEVAAYDPDTCGTVRVSGGLPTLANGLLAVPCFAQTRPKGETSRLGFLTYDSANDRLAPFTDLTEGVVEGTVADVFAGVATVPADATVNVKALRVRGFNGKGNSLTLSSGSRLVVGEGTAPACVLLNAPSDGDRAIVAGPGTLDFGAREGVIAVGRSHPLAVNCTIAGENGLTLVGAVDGCDQTLRLAGSNTYAGETRINGVAVVPQSARAFSTGKVILGHGHVGGGCLRLQTDGLVLANPLEVSGYGSTRGDSGQYGAICFDSVTATFTGPVNLAGKSRVSAPSRRSTGVFAGTISGDRLQVWGFSSFNVASNGVIRLTADNAYTNGTEVINATLELAGGGTLGTGPVELDGGVLAFDKAADYTLPNRVGGIGTIRLLNRNAVAFADLASRESGGYTLDAASRICRIASLKGFREVTSSLSKPVTLCVLDGQSFDGAVAANVTLVRGEYKPAGLVILFR